MLDGFMAAFVVLAIAAMLWAMRAPPRTGAGARWLLGSVLLGLAVGGEMDGGAVPRLCRRSRSSSIRLRDGRGGAADRSRCGAQRARPAALARAAGDPGAAARSASSASPTYFADLRAGLLLRATMPLDLEHLLPFQLQMYAAADAGAAAAHLSVELVELAADDPADLVSLRTGRRRAARRADARQSGGDRGAGWSRWSPASGAGGAMAPAAARRRAACGSARSRSGSSSRSRSAFSIIIILPSIFLCAPLAGGVRSFRWAKRRRIGTSGFVSWRSACSPISTRSSRRSRSPARNLPALDVAAELALRGARPDRPATTCRHFFRRRIGADARLIVQCHRYDGRIPFSNINR